MVSILEAIIGAARRTYNPKAGSTRTPKGCAPQSPRAPRSGEFPRRTVWWGHEADRQAF
jgi:hypothetical protein